MDISSSQLHKKVDTDNAVKDIEVCGPLYKGGTCNLNSCAHSTDHYHCPVCGHSSTEVTQALAHVRASPACRKDATQGHYPPCSLSMASDAATANSLYSAIYGGITAQNTFPAPGYSGYGQMDSFQWHPTMPVDKVAMCSTQLSPCCSSNGTNRIPIDGQLCSPLGDMYSKVTAPMKDLVSLPAKSGGTTMDSQSWFTGYNSQQIQYKYPEQNSLPQINFLLLDPTDQKHQDMNLLSAVDPNINLASSYSVKADINGRDLLKEPYCSFASQPMAGMLPEDTILTLQFSDDTLKQAEIFQNHQQTFLPQINTTEQHPPAKKLLKADNIPNPDRHQNRFNQDHFGNCVSSCCVYSSSVAPVKHLDPNDENSNQTTSSTSDSDESDIIVEDTGDELGNDIAESEISIEDIKCTLLQGVISEEENIHSVQKSAYFVKSRQDTEKLRKEQEVLGNFTKASGPPHEPCPTTCGTELRCAVCSKSVSEQTPVSCFIQMSSLLPVTSGSNTPIISKLTQIISTNLVEFLNQFGNFICQRCFSLVDTVDVLEMKLDSARRNLTSIFKTYSKPFIANKHCRKLVVDLLEDNQQSIIEISLPDIPKEKSLLPELDEVALQNVDPMLSRNLDSKSHDIKSDLQRNCSRNSQKEVLSNVGQKDTFLIVPEDVPTLAENQEQVLGTSQNSCLKKTCDESTVQGDSCEGIQCTNATAVLPSITHVTHQPVKYIPSEQQNLSDLHNEFFVGKKEAKSSPLALENSRECPGEAKELSKDVGVIENTIGNVSHFSRDNPLKNFQENEEVNNPKLNNHIKADSNLLCETCGKHFNLQKHLNDHKARHKRLLRQHCQYCGKSFASASLLVVHLRTHTGEKPFSCSTCKRGFAHRSNLTAHQNICCGSSPFQCNECDQIFPLQSALNKHIKLAHELVLEHLSCSECNRSFTKPSDLLAHQRVHSSDRSFACEVCGRRYKSLGNLNHHLKSHMSKRPFTCEICNLGFLRKESLEAHVHSHKGERPFTCDQCPKSFWSKKNLKSHLKWHDGTVKKNTCPVCDKTFTQKLCVHMRTHTGEKPFSCPFCSQSFATKCSRNKHCQAKHPPGLAAS